MNIMSNTLIAHLSAKICHDLATPLGALGMGLESLRDDINEIKGKERDHALQTLSYIDETYKSLEFKLKFYRLWLASSDQGPPMAEIVPMLQSMAHVKNINLKWDLTNPIESANLKRFLLGAVYIMMEPLIRGGICSVSCDAQKMVIKSTGSVCPMRPEYKQLLSQGNDHTITAETRNILCFYLVSLAREANLHIAFHAYDQAIELSATYGDA